MIKIEQKFIPEHRANRRAFAKGSAYYQKFRKMDYITIHDVGSDGYHARGRDPYWYYRYIAEHSSTENPPKSRKAWHLTIGSLIALQHLRFDEIGLHSGEGVFPGVLNGNTNSIGIEMCRSSNPQTMDTIIDNTAWVCAWLIHTGKVNKPYPTCLRTHRSWSGKYCPAVLLSRPNGWTNFVSEVGRYIKVLERGNTTPPEPAPPVKDGNYLVLAGSYANIHYAETQLKAIRAKGWSAVIQPAQTPQGQRYRVVAGSYEDLSMAESLVNSLKRDGFVAQIIEIAPPAPPKPTPPQTDVWYRVVAGSWRNREYADRAVARLKKAGYDAFIDVRK